MYCAGGLLNELFHFTLNVVRNFSPFNVPLFIINNIVYSLARSLAFYKVRWTGLLLLVMEKEGSRTEDSNQSLCAIESQIDLIQCK